MIVWNRNILFVAADNSNAALDTSFPKQLHVVMHKDKTDSSNAADISDNTGKDV
jgi:hypothetical protein